MKFEHFEDFERVKSSQSIERTYYRTDFIVDINRTYTEKKMAEL